MRFSPRCPEDSILIEGYAPPGECCPLPSRCVCDPAGCLRKVCQPGYLNILVSKASGKPGECCDLYECKPGMRLLAGQPHPCVAEGNRPCSAFLGLSTPPRRAFLILLLWVTFSLYDSHQRTRGIIPWCRSSIGEATALVSFFCTFLQIMSDGAVVGRVWPYGYLLPS